MQMDRAQRTTTRPKRKASGDKISRDEQARAAAREATQAAKVAAEALPAAIDDIFHTTYRQQSLSVVTVSCSVMNEDTTFGTGFALFSQQHCTLIVISSHLRRYGGRYGVYFSDKSKFDANIFLRKEGLPFVILSVQDVVNRKCVDLTNDDADYEAVTIIGAMAGTQYGFNSSLLGIDDGSIPELIGALGNYKGIVLEPTCEAFDSWGNEYPGTQMYFTVGCPMQDKLLPLSQIDDEDDHTVNEMISAPIFRLDNGEMIGLIYGSGDCSDVKIGLHAKDFRKYLVLLCGADDWKESIKPNVHKLLNKWKKMKT